MLRSLDVRLLACLVLALCAVQGISSQALAHAEVVLGVNAGDPQAMSIGAFAPVTRKAIATPGSAACDSASPPRLRWRSTANEPSTPAVSPSTAAPVTTTASV
jgi:hypothetical protein